jgi:double-strand break repair protein MRE11
MAADSVKVEKLVREYLGAQALKILPQAPFGDAIAQFVSNDDKHAMDTFIEESLSAQVKQILEFEQDDDEADLDPLMESIKAKQEALFADGKLKVKKTKKGNLRPRPETWDTDEDGEWADQPGAMIYDENQDSDDAPVPKKRGKKAAVAISDEDDASVASIPVGKKAPAKKAPAKRAPAKPKAPAKTAAKAPAKSKAPAKAPARRNKVLDPSDDEDEDDDVIMLDEAPPPPKAQPKRAAAARGRQTQLNFSQPKTQTQTARELSDDEISDDDAL